MATVSESRVSCLGDCWFDTSSQNSDNEDHSEHDSDYETDDEDVTSKTGETIANVQWTGYGKKIPVLLFSVDAMHKRKSNYRTIAEQYNLTFKFASSDCKIVRTILLSHGFIENSYFSLWASAGSRTEKAKPGSVDYNLLWCSSHLKPSTLRFMADFQKINHFPRSCELTRKDRLFRNIQRMQLMKGHRHFDFIPASYVLPGDYQEFYAHFQKNKGLYIVKPVASSQGRGVFLVSHPEQVPLDEHVIVSKYISAPLVIDGFKFDVRCYVAVTSYDPLVIYMYEEGLTRFATVKYEKDMKYLRNQCMHLTNYSVNKRSQYYVRNADADIENFGNKWSMSAMLRHLRSTGQDTAALMMQIENIVIKTILSAESSIVAACKMYQPFRGNCFELYGFDILIDENLKPWILEVNFSPSLACDTPLDLKIKGNMLCDLFSLMGVICQDPTAKRWIKSSRQRRTVDKTTGKFATNLLPMKSASEEKDFNIQMSGLNSEEIKILRRVKEEESRKGGWIRIFPSADSWDRYGHLLHSPDAHNFMLHQRLFPDRRIGTSSGKTYSISSAKQSLSKNKMQPFAVRNGKVGQEAVYFQKDSVVSESGLIRAKQYERKLKQLKTFTMKSSAAAMKRQENSQVENSSENECEDTPVSKNGKDNKLEQSKTQLLDVMPGKTGTKMIASMKSPTSSSAVSSNSSTEGSAGESTHPQREPVTIGRPYQFLCRYLTSSKTDLLTLVQNGYKLSTVQARTAFAMYLARVQERLLSDWSDSFLHRGKDATNDQMELVLRFLKCAATDLPQTVHSVVPNKKLPMQDRKKVLAEQLGIFIDLYNKETEDMKARKMRKTAEMRIQSEMYGGLSEHDFTEFVSAATENELEAVLMAFAKSNKSSAVFLGGDSDVETDKKLEVKDRQQYSCHSHQSNDLVTFGAKGDSAEVKEANSVQTKVTSRIAYRHIWAQHRRHSQYLCSGTAAIYTQKLGRPHSATTSGASRAGSASTKRSVSHTSQVCTPPSQNSLSTTSSSTTGSTSTKCSESHTSQVCTLPSQNSLSTTSSSTAEGQTENTVEEISTQSGSRFWRLQDVEDSDQIKHLMTEDAIHQLNIKLQLLKSSCANISSQITTTGSLMSPQPSSFADPSSAKLPETLGGDLELLLRNKSHRKTATKITSKHEFTLVGKSITPLTNRKQIKRKSPETKSTLPREQSSRR